MSNPFVKKVKKYIQLTNNTTHLIIYNFTTNPDTIFTPSNNKNNNTPYTIAIAST